MKIVHLADLHLGYRAYYRLDSKGLNIREKDVLNAFKESLDRIAELNPDLVLIAGDIFHKPRPSNTTIYLTIKLLQSFRQKCSTPVVMISGNHEASKSIETGSVLKILETTVPMVKVVDGDIEHISVDNAGINVLCVPYNKLTDFEKTSFKPDKDYKYNILMLHGSYNTPKCPELIKMESGSIIDETHINRAEWDYVALGHYHRFTEIAPNTFYSGAIERTSTNIWQESKEPKGFIEFNLDKKTYIFHELKTPRKVVDIKKLNAASMTADDVNGYINDETVKIKDLDKSIVRMTIENIDPVAVKSLDFKKIRELKKTAVHFRANFIKKDTNVTFNQKGEVIEKQKDIFEYLDEELTAFELSCGLDKEKFGKMAKNYLLETIGAVK